MDLTPALLPILQGPGKQLLAGLLVAVLVQAAKKADSVTILPEDNAKRIKAASTALSFVAAALVAYTDGNLSSMDWSTAGKLLADGLVVVAASAGTWALALKGKK